MWKITLQLHRHNDKINAVTVDSKESKIATASTDGTVGLYDTVTQRQLFLAGHGAPVSDAAFSPVAQIIASADANGMVILWDAETGEQTSRVGAHSKTARCVRWSPDGEYIVTGGQDRTTSIWSANGLSRAGMLPSLGGWVRALDWHENVISVGGNDRNVMLYDVRTNKVAQQIPTESSSDITSLSFHRDGSILAGAGFDRSFRLWDIRASGLARAQEAHAEIVTHLAFNHDTDDLLTAGVDGITRIWNGRACELISSFHEHDGPVNSCCWFPKTRGFLSVGDDLKVIAFEDGDETVTVENGDGGDVMNTLRAMQEALSNITDTMKSLDNRLLGQEERVKWLRDNNDPILQAYSRTLDV